MKKVLVTGNKGYVGTVLCKLLKSKNFYVVGVDANWFTSKKQNTKFVDRQINLAINNLTSKHLKDIDYIVHLASISNDPMSEKFKKETYEINLYQSKNFYNLAKNNNIKKFIFASSCSLYGLANQNLKHENSKCNPLTNYSKTKFLFEKFLSTRKDKVKKIILRFGTAAGTSENFRLDLAINNLVFSGLKQKKIKVMSNGKPFRPFIDTLDMSKSILFFLQKKLTKNLDVFNVGINKNNIQIKNLAKIISKKLKIPYTINNKAADDKRTYKVNFNKFKKNAPTIIKRFKSIEKIVDEVTGFMKSRKFRLNSANFRLKHLEKKYLTKNKPLA